MKIRIKRNCASISARTFIGGFKLIVFKHVVKDDLMATMRKIKQLPLTRAVSKISANAPVHKTSPIAHAFCCKSNLAGFGIM